MIQSDDVQIRDNLTYEILPLWIKDREVKDLREKEIPLVKVEWGGLFKGSVTWGLKRQMKESYPKFFFIGKIY